MMQKISLGAGGQQLSLEQTFELARNLHRQNSLHDAETLYRRLLEAVPDQPAVLNSLAILRSQRGDDEEAATLLQRAVKINPKNADAHNNLGNVLKQLDRIDEAAAAYQRVLRLNPNHADAHNNLGVIQRRRQQPKNAETAFRKAIRCNPQHADAYYNLSGALVDLGRLEEAVEAIQKTLALHPGHTLAYTRLGRILYRLGRVEEAANTYRDLLRCKPDDPIAQHMLAACTGENIPQRASDHFVRTLFDSHAESFDEHLVERLQYQAPQLLIEALAECYDAAKGKLDILDAGCGTGLCGPLLKPYARALVGVDLSPKMLRGAQQREIYDALAEAELTAFLHEHPDAYDVIVSADTLCYFGQLEDFSEASARALCPGGCLLFTAERSDQSGTPGFVLTDSGRYAHHEDYLRATLTAAGFAIEAISQAVLRIERGRPTEGIIVTARLRS